MHLSGVRPSVCPRIGPQQQQQQTRLRQVCYCESKRAGDNRSIAARPAGGGQ